MRRTCYVSVLVFLLFICSSSSWGKDEVENLLPYFVEDETPAVKSAVSPRPISRVAENVSIITSDQIARINAHTLADILQTVPGIQINSVRTPGDLITTFTLMGMDVSHILVLLDGVPQNDPTNNRSDIGLIPAQIIERVEIIKGAASAAWGPALGGVVNVITRSPDPERKFGGALSASYGERNTTNPTGELSGTINRFGYLLSGGHLYSKGLRPGNGTNYKHTFSKLTYELPSRGVISLSGNTQDAYRGTEESAADDFRDTDRRRIYQLHLNLQQPLTNNLTLAIGSHVGRFDSETVLGQITWTPPYSDLFYHQKDNGTRLNLTWDDGNDSISTGAEYLHYEYKQDIVFFGVPDPQTTNHWDRYAFYLNGAKALGRVTILPGIRYDRINTDKSNVSYTLGATYRLTEKSILRAYAARGFGLPTIIAQDKLQKIWTVQVGAESGDIPYLWVKGTFFYNDAWNVEIYDVSLDTITQREQIRQGFELEAKTVPLYGISLGGGYTYIDVRDKDNPDLHIDNTPTNSLKLSLQLDNIAFGTKGTLLGNYVWWNENKVSNAYYNPIIWDLHLSQKLLPGHDFSPEVFFSCRNLFNGSQYSESLYHNTRRWIEGGVRFRF